MPLDLEGFAERLRELAHADPRIHTQKDLARALGTSESAVSHYVNGKRFPNIDILVRVSGYFHARYEWLLTGEGPIHV